MAKNKSYKENVTYDQILELLKERREITIKIHDNIGTSNNYIHELEKVKLENDIVFAIALKHILKKLK